MFVFLLVLFIGHSTFGQTRWLLWTHHDSFTDKINGLSLGIGIYLEKETNVNGIKVDIPGLGMFVPAGVGSDPYVLSNDSLSLAIHESKSDSLKAEKKLMTKTNGLYVSGFGDVEEMVNGIAVHPIGGKVEVINGISLFGIIGFISQNNGLTVTAFISSCRHSNGLIISGFFNQAVEMNGVQIGLFNKSIKTKGFQFGLWNTNEKRSLPFVNWNFR